MNPYVAPFADSAAGLWRLPTPLAKERRVVERGEPPADAGWDGNLLSRYPVIAHSVRPLFLRCRGTTDGADGLPLPSPSMRLARSSPPVPRSLYVARHARVCDSKWMLTSLASAPPSQELLLWLGPTRVHNPNGVTVWDVRQAILKAPRARCVFLRCSRPAVLLS